MIKLILGVLVLVIALSVPVAVLACVCIWKLHESIMQRKAQERWDKTFKDKE